MNRILTGFSNIDRNVFFEKGNFMIIGSRPLHGKSSLALNIINNVVFNENKVVSLYCTDSKKSLTRKRIDSIYAEIPLSEYIFKDDKYEFTREQQHKWDEISTSINRKNTLLIEDSFFNLEDLVKRINKDVKEYSVELVVIDLLQHINTTSLFKDRFVPINEVSRTLKNLARHLNIAIIGVSSLNKVVDTRDYQEPFLRDLKDKEIGSLEDDADIVILTSIPEIYIKEQERQKRERVLKYKTEESFEMYKNEELTDVLIRVAKHKGLPFVDLKLAFEKKFIKFRIKESKIYE